MVRLIESSLHRRCELVTGGRDRQLTGVNTEAQKVNPLTKHFHVVNERLLMLPHRAEIRDGLLSISSSDWHHINPKP